MKLQFFCVLLLLSLSIFAQNEFEQDQNAEVVENNGEFSHGKTEQNPNDVVADNDEHTDSIEAIGMVQNENKDNIDNTPVQSEQYQERFAENINEQVALAQGDFEQDYNIQNVDNNPVYGHVDTDENPSEEFAENKNEFYNGEQVSVTDSSEVQTNNVENNVVTTEQHFIERDKNNDNVNGTPVQSEQYSERFPENTDEQVVVAQEDFEPYYDTENGDNNAVYGNVDTDQNPSEGIGEVEFYNDERVVQTESPEVESQNFENNVIATEQHINEVAPLDSEQNIKTDPIENLANEYEKNDNMETFKNNDLPDTVESKRNLAEAHNENLDYDENDAETDAAEIPGQHGFQQNYRAVNNENSVVQNPLDTDQNFIEVVPKFEVDADEHDVENDRREMQAGDFQQDDNAEAIETNVDSPTEIDHDVNLGTDFIEILGLPETISNANLRSTIRYSIVGPRILVVEIFTVGVDHMESIFHTEWTEVLYYVGEIKAKLLRVSLPDNLIYEEDKILHISPDLHSESLLVRVSIVDHEEPTVLLLYAEHRIKLTPPWSRLPKYSRRSCNSWIGMFVKNLTKYKILKCPKIDDVVDLLPFPVALVGDEYGYRKFFEKLRESEELHNRPSQFTLATWLYLTKRCSKDMCPLLYHMKATAFQTPLIGLLKSGHLHLQFHYEDGSGYAFLFDTQIPIHEWIHIAVTVKQTVVSVYVRYGKNLEHVKTFVHSDFPTGLYHFNDTDGYWGLGGSPGFTSTYGFIGPAKIYRRHVLSQEAIESIFSVASRPDLGIADHFKSCRKLKTALKFLLKKESKSKKQCASRHWLNHEKRSYCNIGVRGFATEIVPNLIDILNINETTSGDMMQQKIYEYAFNLTKTNESYIKDALPLLSYSSCLGHHQSLYLLSVLYRTGLGVNINPRISQRSLLLGSYYNHPLSQMSLAYKHYVGVDGLPKDYEVASTYYRYAAVQSNRLLVEHNEVDTHSEAVRLDKKEDLENYRGPHSNWFSWLKHQAKRGVSDAQSALGEVFYYGSRGFRRNLTKAAEFYEMGANRGDAQMLFNLGVVKLRGQGVAKNTDEARDLLKKSADLGFAPAYNALGYYELNVRQNKSGAVEYFRFAAEHEDRDGLYNFGFALENGLAPGTVGDLKSALPHYISAANKGHTGACRVAGDAFSLGQHVDRDVKISIIFYKFVADQIPEIGLHLRNGLDGYFEKSWYQSLLYYLLAAEAGMEIAQYNAALLCEWDWELVSQHTRVDCAWRYYNHSAKLEWVPSLIKTGDNHWYGITAEKNITTAAQLYSQAAVKEQNPQAIYNLGYLVENDYPLDGLDWMHFHLSSVKPGNLTLAAALYRKCRDASDEALVPCSLGLVRVAVKMVWQLEMVKSEVLLIPLTLFVVSLALLYYLCGSINNDRQMIDLA